MLVGQFLGYLPSHCGEAPPVAPVPAGSDEAIVDILDVVPESRAKAYDLREVIKRIVDTDSLFELKPAIRQVSADRTGPYRRADCRSDREQSPIQGRLDRHRRLREGDQFPGPLRLLQRADRLPRRPARFPDRNRRREAWRARANHELDERALAGQRAADRDHAAQELRSGLPEHGGRQEQRRSGRVAWRPTSGSWTRSLV